MDKAAVVERVRRYAELVRHDFDVEQVILFGSHVSGTAREGSDIDVAVVVRRLKGNWLSAAARMHKLTRDVDVSIEPVIFQQGRDQSGFLRQILETGEIIYSRGS